MKQLFTSVTVLLVLVSSLFLVGCDANELRREVVYLHNKEVLVKSPEVRKAGWHISLACTNLESVPTRVLQVWLKEITILRLKKCSEVLSLGRSNIRLLKGIDTEIRALQYQKNNIVHELEKRNGNTVIRRDGKVIVLPSPSSVK